MKKLLAFVAILATISQVSAYEYGSYHPSYGASNTQTKGKANWFSGAAIESKLTSDFKAQTTTFAKSIDGIDDWFPKEDVKSSSYGGYGGY